MRIRHLSIVGLLVGAAVMACGDDDETSTPTGPGGSARIMAVTSASPSVQYSTVMADSISVRVVNAAGAPVAGVPVTWTTTGDGAVAPTTSTTDASGIARTSYTGASTPSTQTVTASVPGIVPNAVFTVTVNPERWIAKLSGAQERPTANASTAGGTALLTWDGTRLGWLVRIDSGALGGNVVGSHIHGPADSLSTSGIVLDFAAGTGNTGTLTSGYAYRGSSLLTNVNVSLDSVVALLRNRMAYVNVHTVPFPGGEIRGRPYKY